MRLCVCMWQWMLAYIDLCVYTCMCLCMYVYMWLSECVRVFVYMRCMCVSYMFVYTCTCMLCLSVYYYLMPSLYFLLPNCSWPCDYHCFKKCFTSTASMLSGFPSFSLLFIRDQSLVTYHWFKGFVQIPGRVFFKHYNRPSYLTSSSFIEFLSPIASLGLLPKHN